MNTEKIKYIRDELEITQSDIAKILGCTRSAYSLWEINKNTIPLYQIDKIELGKRIRQARKSINYTQEKLAAKLNTTHSVISAYESGKTSVSTLFLIEIAKLTNKSLNWLLNKID